MYAMFIKEMRQFVRSLALKIAVIFMAASWLLIYLASTIELPGAEVLQNMSEKDLSRLVQYYYMLLCVIGIIGATFAGLICLLGSSAGRWRLELGDPALSPGVTTCTPPWKLAVGKWGALILQLWGYMLFAAILPMLVFYNLESIRMTLNMIDARHKLPESFSIANIFAQTVLILCCCVTVWGSMTLAVCSRKPRSRSRFDIGNFVAMLILGPQALSIVAGAGADTWEIYMIMRTIVFVIGSVTIISAGVAAPGANRLFFFKGWMFLAVLVIMPLLYHINGVFDMKIWSEECLTAACFFLFCSLFERLTQSRRVLAQMKTPAIAAAAFPLTTGALNSCVLAGIFTLFSYLLHSEVLAGSTGEGVLLMAAAVSLCNMAGYFFERRNWRFIRWAVFILLAVVYGLAAGIIGVEEYKAFFAEHRSKIMLCLAVLTLIFNVPLLLNYNYRKKNL